MKKDKIDWRVLCTALVSIAVVESIALFQGFNGTMLTIALAAIAGIAGWTMPQLKTR